MSMKANTYLTIAEASRLLAISLPQTYTMARRGELGPVVGKHPASVSLRGIEKHTGPLTQPQIDRARDVRKRRGCDD